MYLVQMHLELIGKELQSEWEPVTDYDSGLQGDGKVARASVCEEHKADRQ
jgi:hypothetical protein